MPYTDANGTSWPDVKIEQGVKLILDPAVSVAKGRPTYRRDPQQQKEYSEKYGFSEKAPRQPSALEGVALTGASIGTGVLGAKVGSNIGGYGVKEGLSKTLGLGEAASTTASTAPTAATGTSAVSQGISATQAALPGAAATTAAASTVIPAGAAVPAGYTAVGTSITGGTMIAPTASMAGTAGTAGAAGSAGAGAAGTTGTTLGSVAVPVAAALAAIWNYNKQSDKYKGMTAGEGFKKSLKDPLNWVIPSGMLGAAFGNKNITKEAQKKKYKQLLEAGLIQPNEYGIIQDMGHGDKELYSGKLKGKDVWGVSGMFDTFGQDWLGKYTEDQREKIAQQLLDERLLDSKKGITRIVNPERAKQIATAIATGQPIPTVAGQAQPTQATTPAKQNLASIGATARPTPNTKLENKWRR